MHFSKLLFCQWLLPGVLSFPSTPSCAPDTKCKAVPGSSGWPSKEQWQRFNSTLSGKLLAPAPPGIVCHRDRPTFNRAACKQVASQWTSSDYHARLPITMDYNDDSCFPNATAPCFPEAYPQYVVNASSAADVKKGVDFAREHNIRLTLKGTGHDYHGRSSAPSSLAIWTHHIRDLDFHDSFSPEACESCASVSAVKIGAGLRWAEIQKVAAHRKVMVVGGADPNVGVGGYLMGGGHSPISAAYGLAPDQALEFEVVTAAGDILTVNECNNKDLFWALRGGGPSFAILASVTVKTYPTKQLSAYLFTLNTTGDSDSYWKSNAYFHSKIPELADSGAMGYYYAIAKAPGVHNKAQQGQIYGLMLVLDKSSAETESIFKPIDKFFNGHPFADKTPYFGIALHYDDFYSWFKTNPAQTVGSDVRLGSRLLDRDALTSNATALENALRQGFPGSNVLIGHIVAGTGVKNAKPAGGDDAVNPAWRKAYTHIVTAVEWPFLDEKAKKAVTKQLTNERVAALRKLAPESGAYVNEADTDEPNWQHAFWGDHYGRLLDIKEKYDPQGIFYCFPCVGAEKWKLVGDQLCPA